MLTEGSMLRRRLGTLSLPPGDTIGLLLASLSCPWSLLQSMASKSNLGGPRCISGGMPSVILIGWLLSDRRSGLFMSLVSLSSGLFSLVQNEKCHSIIA